MPLKRTQTRSTVRTKFPITPITPIEYGGLQAAFNHLNATLFDGALPDVMIVLHGAHSGGHFSPDRFSSRVGKMGYDEISLNPDGFIGKSDEQIMSILLHEMVHLWQNKFGKPSARGYHNKEWAAKMKALGLMPSNSGMVGGKETGQQMAHYIIPDGGVRQAFAALAATGWKLNLQSAHPRWRQEGAAEQGEVHLPGLRIEMWGKPDSKAIR